MTKPWYKSKTIWFNILTGLALLIAYFSVNIDAFGSNKEMVVLVIGAVSVIVNFGLRLTTDTKIGT